MKQFFNLTLSTNKESSIASNFILQSKTVQTILELVYKLAEHVEDESDMISVEVLNMLHDIRLLKELHIQQLSKLANDRTLSFLLDSVSPEYKKILTNQIRDYQAVHNITQQGEII